MKPITYGLGILTALFAVGLIGLGLIRVMAQSNGDKSPSLPVANAVSTTTTPGDLERIPIYPNARVVTTTFESIRWNQVIYEMSDGPAAVEEFYKLSLPDQGWKFLTNDSHTRRYIWTDTSGLSPWHLFVDVLVAPIEEKVTQVTLTFGRYPDVQRNLPVVPDAQEAKTITTRSEQESEDRTETVDVTIKTFSSKLSPAEVKSYYVSEMEQFGWILPLGWSPPIGPSIETSDGSLHLIARPVGETMLMLVGVDLNITTSSTSDGNTLVELRVVETRLIGGGW